MKAIYTAILARLREKVPALKWIDLDEGQLDIQTERPAVAFPCAIVSINLPGCEDIYSRVQHCRANVTIRIAQSPSASRTNLAAPEPVRESALQRYDLIDSVYMALQGFETDEFCLLSRTRQGKESRRDGLFVSFIEFQTEFEDKTAEN